nr:13412_t:CDS:2 [Entrophospora candida]
MILTLDQVIEKISYTLNSNSGRSIKNISSVINSGGKYLSWEETIPDNTMTGDETTKYLSEMFPDKIQLKKSNYIKCGYMVSIVNNMLLQD